MIEFIVVVHREDHRVQEFELPYVLGCQVTKDGDLILCARSDLHLLLTKKRALTRDTRRETRKKKKRRESRRETRKEREEKKKRKENREEKREEEGEEKEEEGKEKTQEKRHQSISEKPVNK